MTSKRIFPLKVMSRFSARIADYLRDNINNYDVIHFEFTHAAWVCAVAPTIFQGKKVVVSSHDILIQGKLRSLRRGIIFSVAQCVEVSATYLFENDLYKLANKILVQSHKDKMLLESLYLVPGSRVEVIDPYLSEFTELARKSRNMQTVKAKTLLFWGAMNRGENEEAVVCFVRRFGDVLKEKGYVLYVVGNSPSRTLQNLASENIIVTGFVEDPSLYFIECEIGIVPLLRGAGIKVKTLEMLKSGLVVISTPIGAEGIDHEKLHVTDVDNFINVIEELQGNGKFSK